MHIPSPSDMAEVTRLTRSGRLREAMALLRKGQAPASDAAHTPKASNSDTAMPDPGEVARSMMGAMFGNAPDTAASPTAAPAQSRFRRARAKPAQDDPRFRTRRYSAVAGSRDYKLYVPASLPTGPVPLVVMLHGCTQSPDDFAAGTRMNELAEEQGFLVAYPAQSKAANVKKCWNWFSAADQMREQGEPSLIAGITREIMAEHAVDPGRVYVAGLSAGGAAAAIMGAVYPELYAAVGVHSGLPRGAARDMASAFAAMQGANVATVPVSGQVVPTIVFHGDGDKTVHPANAESVITQASAGNRFTVKSEDGRAAGDVAWQRTVHTDAGGRAVLENWTIRGAGHAWSGGSQAGTYTDPNGPDASREMLRFFFAQTA
ncbi:extracellular catalytic domain type 1 short-chain-length polyhydroxyalkanoate depolymerase [Hyphomonas atlantica]|uniref:extracellular catalytic domain type 1 short-chain-length polyhydroxyalkanoate depolymerase n=1 Tax=Hyphomonas atlantica TaxID=1280948 RepID=UPI0035116224